MTLSAFDLRMMLFEAGIAEAVTAPMGDATYMPCKADWLLTDFHGWLFRALKALDISEYAAESGDCDDATNLFITFARILHRRTPEGRGHALPLGYFGFKLTPNAPAGPAQQSHAIVWAVTSDRGILFIEPQVIGKVMVLTKAQIASCHRCSD